MTKDHLNRLVRAASGSSVRLVLVDDKGGAVVAAQLKDAGAAAGVTMHVEGDDGAASTWKVGTDFGSTSMQRLVQTVHSLPEAEWRLLAMSPRCSSDHAQFLERRANWERNLELPRSLGANGSFPYRILVAGDEWVVRRYCEEMLQTADCAVIDVATEPEQVDAHLQQLTHAARRYSTARSVGGLR